MTLAAYPLVPKSEVGFRIQVTAANSQARDRAARRRARQARATRSTSALPDNASTRRDRSHASTGAPASGSLPRRRRAADRRVPVVPAAEGQRPVDQPARPLLARRDRRRDLPAPAAGARCPGCSSSSASSCSSPATSTRTATEALRSRRRVPVARRRHLPDGLSGPRRRDCSCSSGGGTPQGDRAAVIDSLILTVGIALISWVFLVAPNVHALRAHVLEKAVSTAYPLGDILLLAAAIRLAVDQGKRAPAFYLLVGSIVCAARPSTPPTRTRCSTGRVQPPAELRRRLDRLLPALGRRRAPPVDADARGARARVRARA